jgi:hypothetical protein
MAVHGVDVDDGAATALGRGDLVGEVGKVRGKDGWGEFDHFFRVTPWRTVYQREKARKNFPAEKTNSM